jgi:hypothetical protein
MTTKKVSTKVNTGDAIYHNGYIKIVGMLKNGLIELKTVINKTSAISEQLSTKRLNETLKTCRISECFTKREGEILACFKNEGLHSGWDMYNKFGNFKGTTHTIVHSAETPINFN